jgi:hypothetical protein
MESAVRSTWVESATIATLQKHRWCCRQGLASMRQKPDVSRRALSARNGIFGCGDRAVEIAARDNVSPQRQKGAETGSANSGTNGQSELNGKIPGSQGLGGGACRFCEPVSVELTGINRAKSYFRAILLARMREKRPRTSIFLRQFPSEYARELRLDRREFLLPSREGTGPVLGSRPHTRARLAPTRLDRPGDAVYTKVTSLC